MAPQLTRQFVWTVIPAGRIAEFNGQQMAWCTLLITPRLLSTTPSTAQTLGDFGLQDWPQLLNSADLTGVRYDNPAAKPTNISVIGVPYIGIEGAAPPAPDRSAWWKTVFPPDTVVAPYQGLSTPYDPNNALEFPASQAGQTIKNTYAAASSAQLSAALVNDAAANRTGPRPHLAQMLSPTLTADLQQAYDFYRKQSTNRISRPATPDVAGPQNEFHSVVSRLADHPLVLRALGLLIDVAVPISDLPNNSGALSVRPSWPNPDPMRVDIAAVTAYSVDAAKKRFVPDTLHADTASPYTWGMLAAGGAALLDAQNSFRFQIVPFDVDGAALRMVSHLSDGDPRDPTDPNGPGLPALRTAGFGLLDTQRKTELDNRARRANDRADPNSLADPHNPLTAENLIGGYRLDIFDEAAGKWRSLCRRRMEYGAGTVAIGADQPGGLLEEGYVRVDSVTADDANTAYLHQVLARFDGWSAVASRPDRIPDATTDPTSSPLTVSQAHDPGSLPRLRFANRDTNRYPANYGTYRMRVRLADLAGGGIRLDEPATDEQQSQSFPHCRFEPIKAPELLPTRAYVDGEGQAQLVIRSDPRNGLLPDDYAREHPAYRPYDLRYLFAPKATLDLAIAHGMFDQAMGTAAQQTVDTEFIKAVRADLDVKDIIPGQPPIGTGGAAYYTVPESPAKPLPWLPDPAARGVVINPRSGTVTGITQFDNWIAWKGAWPDYSPMVLDLKHVAGVSGCQITRDKAAGTWTIALAPGQQATLDIASFPSLGSVAGLGMALWAGADPISSDPATPGGAITQAVCAGHLRTVTPPRTITVVHAVQQPLNGPGGRFTPGRFAGDTFAVLQTIPLQLDIASTARIDVHAQWSDIDDNVSAPGPTHNAFATHIGSYDVAGDGRPQPIPTITHTFGDTRARHVTYSVTAISRFHDYFETITATNPDACTVGATLQVTDIPTSARPPAPKLRYAMPAFAWTRNGAAGGNYTSTRAGGLVRVFLERPWFASGADEALAVIVSADGTAGSHLSVAGRDPIWATGATHSPLTAADFGGGQQVTVRDPVTGETTTVVVYPLDPVTSFDSQLNCWIVDVDLSPLVVHCYSPFVRLSLCRYQPTCIPDVSPLSPPVQTEPIQLFAQRDLALTWDAANPNQFDVVLNGDVGPDGPNHNTVAAELQSIAGAVANPSDLIGGAIGWKPGPSVKGALNQPLTFSRSQINHGDHVRVVVTETENYQSQTPSARIVYTDTIAVQ
jgi:hypothetical protein